MKCGLATIAHLLALIPAARAADLTITVERLRSSSGAVLVAVHGDPALVAVTGDASISIRMVYF